MKVENFLDLIRVWLVNILHIPCVHGLALRWRVCCRSITSYLEEIRFSLSLQQSTSSLLDQIALSIFYFPHSTSVSLVYALINICPCLGHETYNYISIVSSSLWFWLILVFFCLCLLSALSEILSSNGINNLSFNKFSYPGRSYQHVSVVLAVSKLSNLIDPYGFI